MLDIIQAFSLSASLLVRSFPLFPLLMMILRLSSGKGKGRDGGGKKAPKGKGEGRFIGAERGDSVSSLTPSFARRRKEKRAAYSSSPFSFSFRPGFYKNATN